MDYCKTCVYYPPSSCDGKPCTQCDITNPFLTCYREKEFVLDAYEECEPKTNADRIRAMTDEELANWLGVYCNGQTAQEVGKPCVSDIGSCEECWIDWLKEECES